MFSDLDISEIKRSLHYLGNTASVSEAHGMLCGLLCGNSGLNSDIWLELTTEKIAEGDLLAREARVCLKNFFQQTVNDLADNNLNFE